MKTLSFTDQEALELSHFYKKKLDDAEKRLLSIKGILQRLSEANLVDAEVIDTSNFSGEVDSDSEDFPELADDEEDSSIYSSTPADDIIVTSEPQEVEGIEVTDNDLEITRFNWVEFIRWTLERNESVYTMAEIVDMGISCYNLNKNERAKISKKLTPFFTHLLKTGELRKFNLDGLTGYYYGLSDWFLKNGRVKKPYIIRFSDDNKKAKKPQRFHENDLQDFAAAHLFETRKLLTLSELVEAAKAYFGFPESDRHIFVFNFKDEIKRMTSVNQLITQEIPGKDEAHFALPSWFKTNNEIRKPFITW